MNKACFLGVVEGAVVDFAVPVSKVSVTCVAKAQVIDMPG